MKKIFSVLAGLVMSAILGVSYIKPEVKVYQPDQYYKGNQTDSVDVRGLYNSYRGNSITTVECDKAAKELPEVVSLFDIGHGNSRLLWFWAMREPIEGLLKPKDDSNLNGYNYKDSTYWWEVPANTYLISIGDSSLIAASQHVNKAYPEYEDTNGVTLSLVIQDRHRGKAFRVTYKSMLNWWCCMDKKSADYYADEDISKPRYGHSVKFSDNDRFTSGSVIGKAGLTAFSKRKRDVVGNKAIVGISIEECGIEEGVPNYNWVDSSLEELYGTRM